MIEAAIFDFGGVIVPSPFGAFARWEVEQDLPPGALRAINARNPDDNAWARFERGTVQQDEFATLFAAEAAERGLEIDGHAVLALLHDALDRGVAEPAMLDAIARLRADGRRVAVLTNNTRPLRDSGGGWIYDDVDVVIESCLAGLRKPDAAVYELACERLHVDPQRTVMLDDLGINLKPARALGMATIKVVDTAAALAELDRLIAA